MRVAILDDYQSVIATLACYAKLAKYDVRIFHDNVKDVGALAERIGNAEALVLTRERTPVGESLLAKLPALRMISQTGKNAPHIDMAACTRRGIVVSGGGGLGHATAELTWGLIFASLRHIPKEVASLKAGNWQSTMGAGVHGRTLGIYGFGRLGGQVARVGKAFGMRVIVWGREGSQTRAREEGFEIAASKAAFFAESDVLSVHLILRSESQGIIGPADFARMKPTALFVNTSRAGLVERGALEAALGSGRPGRAAVDVFDEEPVLGGNHPLLRMDNVIATPHLGYVERAGYESFFNAAFDQINAFAFGAPINVMNPEVLSR
jgi:D-3-phosphoglycerate dehydrogenase / 2-oxoglutarate reductase